MTLFKINKLITIINQDNKKITKTTCLWISTNLLIQLIKLNNNFYCEIITQAIAKSIRY